MKKLVLTILSLITLGFIFGVIAPTKAKAYITERVYDRIYEVQDDYLNVTEKKTLNITQVNWYIPQGSEETFIIFNPALEDPQVDLKRQLTLDSLKVTDSLGNNLVYSLEDTDKGNKILSVKIGKLVRYGESYTVEINYHSYGLLLKSGAIRDAYIPAFSDAYVFETDSTKESVSTKLISNKKYGEINFSVPSTSVKEDENNYTLEYNQTSLIGDTGWVQIGKKQYYKFDIKQSYTKSSDFPFSFNVYKIVIPRDIKSGFITQKVYFTNISPSPQKVEEDIDGNLIAYFRIPSVDSGEITISGYATLDQNTHFDLTDSGNISDIPKDLISRDTKDGKYWEVDTVEIQNVARELKGSETNVYKLVEKAYKYVIDKIDYSDVKRFGINDRQGALKTLQGGAAVCMEYSDLFITLVRAMGIPARGAFGYGYSSLDYTSVTDSSINHQWAEVYLPKEKLWVPADTTWGESGNLLIGGDLNHFYSHVASVDPETPSTTEVAYYGSSPNIKDRTMNIEVVEEKDISNLNGIAQDNLINEYKISSGLNESLNNILDSFKLLWNRTPNSAKLIAGGIICIGVIILILVILIKRRNKLSLL